MLNLGSLQSNLPRALVLATPGCGSLLRAALPSWSALSQLVPSPRDPHVPSAPSQAEPKPWTDSKPLPRPASACRSGGFLSGLIRLLMAQGAAFRYTMGPGAQGPLQSALHTPQGGGSHLPLQK